MAEFNHGTGLRELTDQYVPAPGSEQGFEPLGIMDSVVFMLQGGGRSLEEAKGTLILSCGRDLCGYCAEACPEFAMRVI